MHPFGDCGFSKCGENVIKRGGSLPRVKSSGQSNLPGPEGGVTGFFRGARGVRAGKRFLWSKDDILGLWEREKKRAERSQSPVSIAFFAG